jgi:hypothetical protein
MNASQGWEVRFHHLTATAIADVRVWHQPVLHRRGNLCGNPFSEEFWKLSRKNIHHGCMAIVGLARLVPLKGVAPALRPPAGWRRMSAIVRPVERQHRIVIATGDAPRFKKFTPRRFIQ